MPYLDNWSVGIRTESAYQAPELGIWSLRGKIYDHEEFEPGTVVQTSEVEFLCTKTRRAVTKSGTDYILGEPDPEWIEFIEKHQFTLEQFDLDRIPKL